MTSFAISPYTMVAALAAVDTPAPWRSGVLPQHDPLEQMDDQQRWLAAYEGRRRDLQGLSEISAHATVDPARHASWLATHGWPASVVAGRPGDLFLASILSVVAKWKRTGRAYGDKTGAARMALEDVLVGEQVALIPTQDEGITVMVAPAIRELTSASDLATEVAEAAFRADRGNSGVATGCRPGTLDMPMAHLRTTSPATYMLGLRSGDMVVSQAAEAFELQLSHRGAVARAKAELAVTRSVSMKPHLQIVGPYIVGILKGRLSDPLFAAYVDRDSWKEPPAGAL